MRKRGYYCRVCRGRRPNERFSRRGRRLHICKECFTRPVEEREAILHSQEIEGYLRQPNISERNISRLTVLSTSSNPRISALAMLALEVADVKPHKRRRIRILARTRPELLRELEATGLLYAMMSPR